MLRTPVSGSLVNTSGSVMNRPPSPGQHFRIGRASSVPSRCTTSWHGRVLDGLRHQIAQPPDHRQHLQRVHDALGHLRRHQLVDLPREIVERAHAEREAHPLQRSEDIRRDRHVEAGRLLEQQRRPAARALARAIGDGGNLEVRTDRFGDPRQQTALVEIRRESLRGQRTCQASHESTKDGHESTKTRTTESSKRFRVFVFSCFRGIAVRSSFYRLSAAPARARGGPVRR